MHLFHSVQSSTTFLIQHCVTPPVRTCRLSVPVAGCSVLSPTQVHHWLRLKHCRSFRNHNHNHALTLYQFTLSHSSIVNTSCFQHCCLFLLFIALLLLTLLIFLTAVNPIAHCCCHHCFNMAASITASSHCPCCCCRSYHCCFYYCCFYHCWCYQCCF